MKIFSNIFSKNKSDLLKAFIYESLRITGRIKIDKGLLGTNGVARCIMNNNVKLNGYNIPKHCKVFALCGLFNNDGKYFKNPNKFDIEHFLEKNQFKLNYGFCRFGIGKRMCIAQTFVIKLLHFVIPKLLTRYKFMLVDTKDNKKKCIEYDKQRD